MCFISISVRVFFVVILVTSCGTSLAEGTVVCREEVHSVTLSTEEVAVQVVKVLTNYGVIHPHHKYPIEAGGFTAWRNTQVPTSRGQKINATRKSLLLGDKK
jgi:hypothetical protein